MEAVVCLSSQRYPHPPPGPPPGRRPSTAPELAAGRECLAAAELRARAAVVCAQDAATRRLVRALHAALHSAGRLLVWKLERQEECGRGDLHDDEEGARADAFLAVLAEMEDTYGRTVAGRLQDARRWARGVSAVSTSEYTERQSVEVQEIAQWDRIRFRCDFSHDMAQRHGAVWAEERSRVVEREEQTRRWLAEAETEAMAELQGEAADSYIAAASVPQGLSAGLWLFEDEEYGRAEIEDWYDDTMSHLAEATERRVQRLTPEQPPPHHDPIPKQPRVPAEEVSRPLSPKGPSLHEVAVADCLQLEECYREVFTDREQKAREDVVACFSGTPVEAVAGAGSGTAVPPRVKVRMPARLVPMVCDMILAEQDLGWDEWLARRRLVCMEHVEELTVRWRRRRHRAAAPLRRFREDVAAPVAAEVSRIAQWADSMLPAVAETVQEFASWARQYQEDMCMENGLTHGWDLLQHISHSVADRLALECRFLIGAAAHQLTLDAVNPAAMAAAEAALVHEERVAAVRANPLLHAAFEKRCNESDAAREDCVGAWMALVAGLAADVRRTSASSFAEFEQRARVWTLEAARMDAAEGGRAAVCADGAVARMRAAVAERTSRSLQRAEDLVAGAAEAWHTAACRYVTDEVALSLMWCTEEQRAVAGGCCVATEFARRRVTRRAPIRKVHAATASLASESGLRLEADRAEGEMRLLEPEFREWVKKHHEIAARSLSHDPDLFERWCHFAERTFEEGTYALRRNALVDMVKVCQAVETMKSRTRQMSEEQELDAVYAVLDSEELADLIVAGEHSNAMAAGSDVGGQELLRLQVVKAELTGRTAIDAGEAAALAAALRGMTPANGEVVSLIRHVVVAKRRRQIEEQRRLREAEEREEARAKKEAEAVCGEGAGWVRERAKQIDAAERAATAAAREPESAEAGSQELAGELAAALSGHGIVTPTDLHRAIRDTATPAVPAVHADVVLTAAQTLRAAREERATCIAITIASAEGAGRLIPPTVAHLGGEYRRAGSSPVFRQVAGYGAVCKGSSGSWLLLHRWRPGLDDGVWQRGGTAGLAPTTAAATGAATAATALIVSTMCVLQPPVAMLQFTATDEAAKVNGTYALLPDISHNGLPVWGLDTAQGCGRIYVGDEGYWVLAWGSSPASMLGIVESTTKHGGRGPYTVPSWLWYDGSTEEWVRCDAQVFVADAQEASNVDIRAERPPLTPHRAASIAVGESDWLEGLWPVRPFDGSETVPSYGGIAVKVSVLGEDPGDGVRATYGAAYDGSAQSAVLHIHTARPTATCWSFAELGDMSHGD
eukprot:TRINITY_DN24364_c0_g1_i1.p1 TRINITY_DN24364_c0_g1~~TRINITY_DN24364_c0_g1_i1.p1  ORF type:complete len:1319 (+),score=408.68 TRINITY_DN24364_c0_g1_i1:40-3957(+)